MYNCGDQDDEFREVEIYGGGPSCGEWSFLNCPGACSDREIPGGDVELEGGGYVISGGARSKSGKGSVAGGDLAPADSPEARRECSITVDGPVCSNTAGLIVLKTFVHKRDPVAGAGNDPATIVDSAKQISGCDTEECALLRAAAAHPEHEPVVNEVIKTRFKVSGPADSTAWLNNMNIDEVLEQFCKKYPQTYHVWFQMINFAEQRARIGPKELKDISLTRDVLGAGKNVMCVVINTDRIGRSGIHWFCLFVDMRTAGTEKDPFTIEYFNSSGQMARREVADWMNKGEIELESTDNPNSPGTKYHAKCITAAKVQHQIDTDSECGVYALYYIWRRLRGAPIEEFATRIPDQKMVDFRPKIFKNRGP